MHSGVTNWQYLAGILPAPNLMHTANQQDPIWLAVFTQCKSTVCQETMSFTERLWAEELYLRCFQWVNKSTPVLSSGFSWTCLQTQCKVWRVPERWPSAAPGSDAGRSERCSSDPAARLWWGWRRRAGWRSRTDSCGCCSSCSAASCGKTRRLRNQIAQIKHSQLDDITF